MSELCYLCLLEFYEKKYLEKIDLKHIRENHPYIKSIKSYRKLKESLQRINIENKIEKYDIEKERGEISKFLKPFSKFFNPFLINILASLIAAYIFTRYFHDRFESEKIIKEILKSLMIKKLKSERYKLKILFGGKDKSMGIGNIQYQILCKKCQDLVIKDLIKEMEKLALEYKLIEKTY